MEDTIEFFVDNETITLISSVTVKWFGVQIPFSKGIFPKVTKHQLSQFALTYSPMQQLDSKEQICYSQAEPNKALQFLHYSVSILPLKRLGGVEKYWDRKNYLKQAS